MKIALFFYEISSPDTLTPPALVWELWNQPKFLILFRSRTVILNVAVLFSYKAFAETSSNVSDFYININVV